MHQIFNEKKNDFPDFAATFRRSRNVALPRLKGYCCAKFKAEHDAHIHLTSNIRERP